MFEKIKSNKNIPKHIIDDLRYLDDNSPESVFLWNFENDTEHTIASDQIFGKKDIIFSGCSQTHGYYLDYNPNFIWGDIVSNRLNKTSINLAVRGDSIANIINRIYAYIDKFGQPEYIFCLFPDPFRLMSPRDERYLVNEKDLRMNGIIELSQYFANDIKKEFILNNKKDLPNIKQSVIPNTFTIYLNMQAILQLELFCKTSGIVLRYGTWSTVLEQIIESIKNDNNIFYKNFLNMKTDLWDDYTEKTSFTKCHQDSMYFDHKYFNSGYDGSHIGIHRSIHIADDFFKSV